MAAGPEHEFNADKNGYDFIVEFCVGKKSSVYEIFKQIYFSHNFYPRLQNFVVIFTIISSPCIFSHDSVMFYFNFTVTSALRHERSVVSGTFSFENY